MAQVWAGADAGKTHHHCVVIDADGKRLLSRRVANDEPELLVLLADVAVLGEQVTWAADLPDGGAALLTGLLVTRGQALLPIPGRAEITVELKILTARRADLAADRTRVINRLRGLLTGIFPALDRALADLTLTGPLVLLTGYQTPAAIRAAGAVGLEAWLRERKVRNAGKLAAAVAAAAARQHTALPGQTLTASMIATLAGEVMTLGEQIKDTDKLIEGRFHQHESAAVITSLPGIGTLLGAEFLAATSGDMDFFTTPDRLAAFAGLAPAPWDSGRIRGNLHRPKHYHRGLNRVFYISAMISIATCPESRRFYDRKRAEGKKHIQAVLALARRRVNVLWALLRDNRPYQATPPRREAA
jgi:transposase